MHRMRHRDIVHRWEGNPVIGIDDLPFRCGDICNAGAARIDGEYVLLVTVESLRGVPAIYPARSTDGYHFTVADRPLLEPPEEGPLAEHEEGGVLDARIVRMDDDFYLCYDARGRHGFRVGYARTRDFESVERLGLASEPDMKGGALFSVRIGDRFARLERPWEGGSIWISYSDDLRHWGWSEVLMTPRGGFWDANRIGVAAPPIETAEGWLVIYYGVKCTSAGPLFRLGAAMLDRDDPAKVIHRTNVPILSPREDYERIGDVPNLVFSCGAILEKDGELKIYYGASNSCICLGIARVDEVCEACHVSDREF